MLTLVIDSATPACSVALLDGERVVAEAHEVVGRGHAERLLPMIEALLQGRRPGAILVDCGPGSFTGVRVGIAAAQGLRLGWGVPLAGYSSMSVIAAAGAAASAEAVEEITVALPGGHGELFVQSFAAMPLRPLDPIASLLPEAAIARVGARRVAGPGAADLAAASADADALPRAADARLLPLELRSLPPKPIYGRGPDAKRPV